MTKTLILISIFSFFTLGCKRQESIQPFTSPTTVAQSQGRDPDLTIVSGAFTFDQFDVSNPVGTIPVPILGIFVENLAGLFADIFVLLNDDWEIEQEAQFIDIPELDADFFKELQIKTLDFSIIGGNDNTKAKLDFIETITIYVANEEMHLNNEKIVLATYKHNKAALKRCKSKCITLEVAKNRQDKTYNLMNILAGSKRLFIIPKVEINSIPKSEFKISGNIDFRLAFRLPF